MTERLYLTDSFVKDFTSIVEALDGSRVLLDRSAFYPGGGGQPCDLGMLRSESDGATWPVMRVLADGRGVWHEVQGPPPEAGRAVRGVLDWERRLHLMRTHTALHILCGVVWRDYGAKVTGGNMEPLRARMDFEFERMRQELVREIEEKVNLEVSADRPVRVQILPREEAFQIPDLIRTKINLLPPDIVEVRTVEIVGLDLQADGGTHVASTAAVGPIRVTDYKSKGAANKRLVIALEA
jgi:misacylated tRNA(Ala) deacylase